MNFQREISFSCISSYSLFLQCEIYSRGNFFFSFFRCHLSFEKKKKISEEKKIIYDRTNLVIYIFSMYILL